MCKFKQQKTMYIFKKQSVLWTNRLNFKSKRVRDLIDTNSISDYGVIEEKKGKNITIKI